MLFPGNWGGGHQQAHACWMEKNRVQFGLLVLETNKTQKPSLRAQWSCCCCQGFDGFWTQKGIFWTLKQQVKFYTVCRDYFCFKCRITSCKLDQLRSTRKWSTLQNLLASVPKSFYFSSLESDNNFSLWVSIPHLVEVVGSSRIRPCIEK